MPVNIALSVDPTGETYDVDPMMFGTNILTDTNVINGVVTEDFAEAVDQVGATRLRYPAGRAEDEHITALDTNASGTNRLDEDLRVYLDWVKENDIPTTLVLPSLDLSASEIQEMGEWAQLVTDYMGAQADLIVAYEIGNEYWGSHGEDEYGVNAAQIAQVLRDAASGDGGPDIWVQTANIVGGASNYKGGSYGSITDADAIAAMTFWSADERPGDWYEGLSASEYWGSLTDFEQRIIKSNLEMLEHFDADLNITNGFQTGPDGALFDGIVAHYYYDKFFDVWDESFDDNRDQAKNMDLRFSPWEAMVEDEIRLEVTEWNVESDHYNDLGLRAAGALIEQFENMLQLGVDGADFWALRHNTNSAAAGSNNDAGQVLLTPAGTVLKYMHDSLLNADGTSLSLVDTKGDPTGTTDVTVFDSAYKTVIYVTSRTSEFDLDVTLDLSELAPSAFSWTGRHIAIDTSTSDGLSENRAYDEDGDLVSRTPRRVIREPEREELRSVLGDAYDEAWVKETNGVLRTYLPEPDDIFLRPGVTNPTSLADFYFATEADVKALETLLAQSDLGSDISDITFELDPYEVTEITILKSNFVQGTNDADQILGGLGDDILHGENGDDSLTADAGNDSIKGQIGNDHILAGAGQDTAKGGWGNDTLDGGDGDDALYGGEESDVLYGAKGADYLSGDSGEDELFGGEGHDFLYGGDQNDRLHGGDGDDTIEGGNGRDTVFLNLGDDLFVDNTQNDEFGHDTVLGGWGRDTLNGDGGNDHLYGEWGRDSINGGLGNDLIDGGDDNDRLYGGVGNDTLFGGNQYDTLFGGDGDDVIDGGNGRDTVYLNYGNDVFIDNAQDDVHGDDIVWAGWGQDTLNGDGGNDKLYGQWGRDSIEGGRGDDTLDGGDDNDTLDGGTGNDAIFGGGQHDLIFAGDGEDTVEGGLGLDAVYLNEGDDLFIDDAQDDEFGNDSVWGGFGSDTIQGGGGEDQFFGEWGRDSIDGGVGDDLLNGGGDNDILDGGAGADTLIGGVGNDTMTGGLDADVFVMTGDSFTGADLITDFDAAIDVIHLSEDHRDSVTLSDTASGVLVTWDNGTVLLEGETTADLNADAFVYI